MPGRASEGRLPRVAGRLTLAAASLALGLACEPPEQPKIKPEQCEQLADRMLTHTIMETAKTAAQQQELKQELRPKYLQACKDELPTEQAFACAMAAPNSAGMQQCR